MQPHRAETPEEANMMKLLSKIQTLEAQRSLLSETINRKELFNSKIISSLQVKVGKTFTQRDIEVRKLKILCNTRKMLIKLAIEEKDLELAQINEQFNYLKEAYQLDNESANTFFNKLESSTNALTSRLNKTMNKKVCFHAGFTQPVTIKFAEEKTLVKKKRKWTANRKKKNRTIYRKKVKEKEKRAALVSKIKESNTVINLSTEEVPDSVYIFLSKGLGYVPTRKVDQQDLKYDTNEFIRKLSWKAFFKANPELETNFDPKNNLHSDIKVSGFTYPDFSSPLLEEVKTKLFGWIANHTPVNPKHNLTPLELRGRKWITDKLKSQELFVSKADKGGAILIMNFADVKTAIENELFDTTKFEKLVRNEEQQLNHVRKQVRSLTIMLEQRKLITERDKTLIAGLNNNNNPKCAPEYQPESPYAYPLFKIHKLSSAEIVDKKIPPNRLVHASKYGPLYRMEKWASPYLSEISREYCKKEFILDTGDLITNLGQLNESKQLQNENVNLFTLDVKSLYPSIKPELALQAIREALEVDKTTPKKTKTALLQLIACSFENSYITYEGECFKSKIGIPTGGSLSRQIADIFLHWVLFKKITPNLDSIEAIRFWKRFIDDCLGIWRGTKRSFNNFVKLLNSETRKYGIIFPENEVQFGK